MSASSLVVVPPLVVCVVIVFDALSLWELSGVKFVLAVFLWGDLVWLGSN